MLTTPTPFPVADTAAERAARSAIDATFAGFWSPCGATVTEDGYWHEAWNTEGPGLRVSHGHDGTTTALDELTGRTIATGRGLAGVARQVVQHYLTARLEGVEATLRAGGDRG